MLKLMNLARKTGNMLDTLSLALKIISILLVLLQAVMLISDKSSKKTHPYG